MLCSLSQKWLGVNSYSIDHALPTQKLIKLHPMKGPHTYIQHKTVCGSPVSKLKIILIQLVDALDIHQSAKCASPTLLD